MNENTSWLLICSTALLFIMAVVGVHQNSQKQLNQALADIKPVFMLVERPQPEIPVDQRDLHCLATNIYHEARGENYVGMVAVGWVTVNRVQHQRFPNTVCDVVYQARHDHQGVPVKHACQFSWYCDGRPDHIQNSRSWNLSMKVARDVLTNSIPDITDGATFYYNPELAEPAWRNEFQRTAVINSHAFMRYRS